MRKGISRSIVTLGVVALTAVAALTGCSADDAAESSTDTANSSTDTAEINYNDAKANKNLIKSWTESVDAVKKKLGNDVRIIDFVSNGSSLLLQIIDPKNPDELNAWTVEGTSVKQGSAIDYGGDLEKLNSNAFPLSEVNVDGVVKALTSSVSDSSKKNMKVSTLTVGYPLVGYEDDPIQILINLSSERDHDQLRYTIDGELKKKD